MQAGEENPEACITEAGLAPQGHFFHQMKILAQAQGSDKSEEGEKIKRLGEDYQRQNSRSQDQSRSNPREHYCRELRSWVASRNQIPP